jgi:hypothetical protein
MRRYMFALLSAVLGLVAAPGCDCGRFDVPYNELCGFACDGGRPADGGAATGGGSAGGRSAGGMSGGAAGGTSGGASGGSPAGGSAAGGAAGGGAGGSAGGTSGGVSGGSTAGGAAAGGTAGGAIAGVDAGPADGGEASCAPIGCQTPQVNCCIANLGREVCGLATAAACGEGPDCCSGCCSGGLCINLRPGGGAVIACPTP